MSDLCYEWKDCGDAEGSIQPDEHPGGVIALLCSDTGGTWLTLEQAKALRDTLNAIIEEAQKPKPIEAPAGVTHVLDRGDDLWVLVRGQWTCPEYGWLAPRSFEELTRGEHGPVRPLHVGEEISA